MTLYETSEELWDTRTERKRHSAITNRILVVITMKATRGRGYRPQPDDGDIARLKEGEAQ